ncbi:MAG: hypothetical protein QM811_15465 [Pirellulales bacterium]
MRYSERIDIRTATQAIQAKGAKPADTAIKICGVIVGIPYPAVTGGSGRQRRP